VIVVDRGPIAGGMTSRTTAHLAPICDDTLCSLIDLRGEEMARLFQLSQEAAVDRIETIVDASASTAPSGGWTVSSFRRKA